MRVDEVEKLKSQIMILEQQLKNSDKYFEYEEKCIFLCEEQKKLENKLRSKMEENDHLKEHIERI